MTVALNMRPGAPTWTSRLRGSGSDLERVLCNGCGASVPVHAEATVDARCRTCARQLERAILAAELPALASL